MVTHSPSRLGSITTSRTRSGGASMTIEASTRLMGAPYRPGASARGQRLDGLPVAQGALDRGVERVQAHAQKVDGGGVPGQEVVLQALHEGADQLGLLLGDGRGHAAGD